LVVFAASFSVGRHGFSPDEEITALVVRGIAATGAPVLPSGMLYLRGLPYSYAAWLGGALFGHELVVYRGVSLVFALLAVVLIFFVTRAVATRSAGIIAAVVFAASPLLLSAAVFARFYAAFVAAALFAVWLLVSRRPDDRARFLSFLLALVCARLLHEWAVVLALLPLCLAAGAAAGTLGRRGLLCLSAASLVVLVGMQLAFSGVEAWSAAERVGALSPRLAVFGNAEMARPHTVYFELARPAAMLAIALVVLLLTVLARRVTAASWMALAAYAICSFFFQLGMLFAVTAVVALVTPRQVLRHVGAAAIVGGGSTAVWLVHAFASIDAAPSLRTAALIGASTFRYPWEAVAYFWDSFTLLLLAASVAATFQLIRSHRPGASGNRGLALFAFLNLIGLGLTAGEFHWRYILLVTPGLVVLAAQCVDAAANAVGRIVTLASWRRVVVPALAGMLCLALVRVQYPQASGDSEPVQRSIAGSLAVPTEDRWRPEAFLAATSPNDVIVCNDEAGCQYLLGRVDYWLQPSPEITARYVTTSTTDPRGVYTGAPVLSTFAGLDALVRREGRAVAIVMLDTGKFDDTASRAMVSSLRWRHGGTTTRLGGYHEVTRIASDGSRSSKGARP